jgi:hypothetical protein
MISRILAVAFVFGLAGVSIVAVAEEKKKEPKHTIKQVMADAHKSKLIDKVSGGGASKEEKQKLLGLYADLFDNKPPKGDEGDWAKKAGSLVVGAARVLLEQPGGTEELKAAANCKACHEAHKAK